MVGRELQKIRPLGEDHRGLVRGRKKKGIDLAGIHIGKMMKGLKN